MTENSELEPAPIWPEADRLCPDRAFPAYRYVPGRAPHPVVDPRGHSYGQHAVESEFSPLPPERWRENIPYLYGIDLYHFSYFWEAHEVWEALWQHAAVGTAERYMLQGLIQNAAAQLKVFLGVARGARNLSLHAWEKFSLVRDRGACDAEGRFMGLAIETLIHAMERHYGLLWQEESDTTLHVLGRPPRLELAPWGT